MVIKTLSDPNVFEEVRASPAQVHDFAKRSYPKHLKKRYPWAADFTNGLPYGYILPKSKKLFSTARPILGYSATPYAELFKALGKVLTDLIPLTYPSTFGNRSIVQCFEALKTFFQQLPTGTEVIDFNDDLKGFFTSVDHPSIREALDHLMRNTSKRIHPPIRQTSSLLLTQTKFQGPAQL